MSDLATSQAELDHLARDLSMRETHLRNKCEAFKLQGISCSHIMLLAHELESVRAQMSRVEVQKDQIMVSLSITRRRSEASSVDSDDSRNSV